MRFKFVDLVLITRNVIFLSIFLELIYCRYIRRIYKYFFGFYDVIFNNNEYIIRKYTKYVIQRKNCVLINSRILYAL